MDVVVVVDVGWHKRDDAAWPPHAHEPAVHGSLAPGSQASTIELIGKTVRVNANVGVFVTMNPDYAGRSQLPDNLKQLFRSIAMIKPDWQLIAQVLLFSQGFQTAERLAGRAVMLFNLCAQQLSAQPHYDFGLRALKSVLVSAGNIKRASLDDAATPHAVDGGVDGGAGQGGDAVMAAELEVLMRSISETVAPKLIAVDLPVFESLMAGVFPGAQVKQIGVRALWYNRRTFWCRC